MGLREGRSFRCRRMFVLLSGAFALPFKQTYEVGESEVEFAGSAVLFKGEKAIGSWYGYKDLYKRIDRSGAVFFDVGNGAFPAGRGVLHDRR